MLQREEVAEEVRRLISDHITSVEQLEILLLLRAQPQKEWSAGTVSEVIRTSESSAARRLRDLQTSGFLEVRTSNEPVYRFAPGTERLRRATDLLATAYAERRYTVIELIFSKPIDNLRVYADAFRFRKEEDGDG